MRPLFYKSKPIFALPKSTNIKMTTEQLYDIFLANPLITTDSRQITAGCIFFALRGAHFNGNHYASGALESGASYAVIDEPQNSDNERLIVVDDVLETLQQLAAHHRKQLGIPIVAITGSNGKTTTKELTANVLKQKYNAEFTRGNLNNHIGVPLTLLSFTDGTEIGVVEMGANHPGEIGFLCEIARPDFGIITNVGKAHLEGFGSLEGVINAKSEMYRYLEKTGGTIFINAGNPYLTDAAGTALKKITYGTSEGCWLRGEAIDSPPFLNLRIWFSSGVLYFNTRLTGAYNLENVLAAAAIGKHFGVDPLLIKQGVEKYTPSNNRSQFFHRGSNQVIMDAYNANPTSMQASISNLLSQKFPSKVAILGDMLELGEYSGTEHQRIVDLLPADCSVSVILVGKLFGSTSHPEHFQTFENASEVKEYLSKIQFQNSLILIKGSRGIGLEKIIEGLS
jgi:UDP-N-acetylmuramoyl-tripeptide--D-alanyl-D-alanine ligase